MNDRENGQKNRRKDECVYSRWVSGQHMSGWVGKRMDKYMTQEMYF